MQLSEKEQRLITELRRHPTARLTVSMWQGRIKSVEITTSAAAMDKAAGVDGPWSAKKPKKDVPRGTSEIVTTLEQNGAPSADDPMSEG